MAIPYIPEDVVHAIANAAEDIGLFSKDHRVLHAMSSVCKTWRLALQPSLFHTLRIGIGGELDCATFLATERGQAIAEFVEKLEMTTGFATLLPSLVALLSSLPYLRDLHLSIPFFDNSLFDDIMMVVPEGPSLPFCLRDVSIDLPSLSETSDHLKLVAFLNCFWAIDTLTVTLDFLVMQPQVLLSCSRMSSFSLQHCINPHKIVPRVHISSILFDDYCDSGPACVALFQAIRLGGQSSSLRFMHSTCKQLDAFGTFCDLAAEAGNVLQSLSFDLACWDDESKRRWLGNWSLWQAHGKKLARCVVLRELRMRLYVQSEEDEWDLRQSSWWKAFTVLGHISSSLAFLRIVIVGDLLAFETQFKRVEKNNRLAPVLRRFPALKKLTFVLSYDTLMYDTEEDRHRVWGLLRSAASEAEECGTFESLVEWDALY